MAIVDLAIMQGKQNAINQKKIIHTKQYYQKHYTKKKKIKNHHPKLENMNV